MRVWNPVAKRSSTVLGLLLLALSPHMEGCAPSGASSIAIGAANGAGSATVKMEPREESMTKDPDATFSDDWREVDRLISEDKYEAASRRVEEIKVEAREAGNERQWTRALIREVQLRTGLHGYETAVRFLEGETWPEAPLDRLALRLFYAHSLVTYSQVYSWEIRQRERVDTSEELDLEKWTLDQISAEIQDTYVGIWNARDEWGSEGIGELGRYISQNNYPARIRGTLRDAVTYLWVESLSDTGFWRPSHANGVYLLDLGDLLGPKAGAFDQDLLADPEIHPLTKISALLADLETWHLDQERPEAAFEARLERLRRLSASFARSEDREILRADLENGLERLGRDFEWWSQGMAELAELARRESTWDSLVTARAVALEGEQAHPGSVGGLRSRRIVADIESPDYRVQAMATDAPGRRSILVTHKNLPEVHFRAYSLDLVRRVESSRDYNLLPSQGEVDRIVGRRQPAAEWSLSLAETPDYRSHDTYLEPPLEEPGLYLIVASARRSFDPSHNRLVALNLIVGDLVVITRREAGRIEATVRSGSSGKALEGAEVALYRYDYQRGHRRASVRRTDDSGRVSFDVDDGGSVRYFLMASRDGESTLDTSYFGYYSSRAGSGTTSSLLYTDRSIYRPQQKILWKVVAFQGGGDEIRYETLPGEPLSVELLDPNRQVVATVEVETNEFGSASGEFEIPTGRLLGGWWIQTSLGGRTSVAVEEYRRPTFEVTLQESGESLRLNRTAKLGGEARYYFGLPVVTATVDWRVVREPVYPRWWWYGFRPDSDSATETVAAGRTGLDEEGHFDIEFLPAADERDAGRGVTYRYRLNVEVTDEGGETRSSTRSFRLGFVAIEANLETEQAFFRAGEPVRFRILRADLDGAPRPGRGSWRLTRLEQPSETLLPADQRRPAPLDEAAFRTEGDLLRPRWHPSYSSAETLRSWADGETLRSGALEHDDRGIAELALKGLPSGAYRLRYETIDAFGATFEDSREILVVGDASGSLALPVLLYAQKASVGVGGTARVLVHSGLESQEMILEIFRSGSRTKRSILRSGSGPQVIELPISPEDRGGFGVRLTALRDHQLMTLTQSVFVPWEDKKLEVEFESFRDRMRPGERETWKIRVTSKDASDLEPGAAELLAYMYDRSLDFFAPHRPPTPLSLYPNLSSVGGIDSNLEASSVVWSRGEGFGSLPSAPSLRGDYLKFFDGHGIGGLGRRHFALLDERGGAVVMSEAAVSKIPTARDPLHDVAAAPASRVLEEKSDMEDRDGPGEAPDPEVEVELRSDFSETAFWEPHLILDEQGSVVFEFTVPDSVTEWNVWVHALTRDLRAGSLTQRTRSLKELMVRPYLPRFLREGDRAALQVGVNNAGETELSGTLDLEILDPETDASLTADFGLTEQDARAIPFTVAAGGGTTLEIPLQTPNRVGLVAFKVTARAGGFTDGELRPLPLLPGRMHLSQSRFVTLHDADRREMRFEDMAADDDPSLIHEQLVVTLDAQLFYGVLAALPYLSSFPYECTEQTLNRFLSTGIVTSLYDEYPSVERMAQNLSRRDTRFETWDAADPNRKMVLEETPWVIAAGGGEEAPEDLLNVLDPRIARAEKQAALAKLEKAQTSLGGFPWWPGGPPSPYMTLYLLHGFSKGLEFGVEVPKGLVSRAWAYMHRHFLDRLLKDMLADDCCWQTVTFMNYVLSGYPDISWTGGVFTDVERKEMLDFSFRHWREHSPLLKSYLALTLARSGRAQDAALVFDSIMDSAKTTRDQGTFWAPEKRAWLWYNDTIETHAFVLRALTELAPDDERRHGLVQWLLLNKKLNHWKSTRATAEVVYALVHYLTHEGTLDAREQVQVDVGPLSRSFTFEPEQYTGKGNRLIVPGEEIDPLTMAEVVVAKETPGFLFASATWHFSTEKLPEEARGDFFTVNRKFFKRVQESGEWVLHPLEKGASIEVGDQVEVHLSLATRHAAEYVHLRDPRGAGYEPQSTVSRYKWNLGIGWYEEVRDSGTNFFFEWLPAGEYTFKYRLRATMGGTFKIAPATLQSMYAPEFTAYSAGAVAHIGD